MSTAQKKIGKLRSWNQERGFGIIEISRKERYFLHITEVDENSPDPVVGSMYAFSVRPGSDPNRLPVAVDAVPVAQSLLEHPETLLCSAEGKEFKIADNKTVRDVFSGDGGKNNLGLRCPACGFDSGLHVECAYILKGSDNIESGKGFAGVSHVNTKRSYGRRDGLCVGISCEGCSCTFNIIFQQSKGSELVYVEQEVKKTVSNEGGIR